MNITVRRFASDGDGTLSLVHIDGAFACFGLEDEARVVKVAGETRIPAGRYPVRLRVGGGMNGRYQAKFPDLHLGMLHIQNVPDFTWVYIHIGNTDEHTAGCLLVGCGATAARKGYTLTNSTDAYVSLYRRVVDAAAAGELEIEIMDEDGGGIAP